MSISIDSRDPFSIPPQARQKVEAFHQQFGESYVWFACHAAIPLTLKPDLLYAIWGNFKNLESESRSEIPWTAVSDLLMSDICKEVGYELYAMDLGVRNLLLQRLKLNSSFGIYRIQLLAKFLLCYLSQTSSIEDEEAYDWKQVQRWAALAHVHPESTAHELAYNLSQKSLNGYPALSQNVNLEMLRLARVIQQLAVPLQQEKSLITYALGVEAWCLGERDIARLQFRRFAESTENLSVLGIRLDVPKCFREKQKIRLQASNHTAIDVYEHTCESVTLDQNGQEISRTQKSIRSYQEALGNQINLEMVEVPEGLFEMGSLADEDGRSNNEGPRHTVRISSFFFGKYPITQEQYQELMNWNPSNIKGENRPVEMVSWNDAKRFCQVLSQKTGRHYRLPSEAEWEYACRAGTKTSFHFGETISTTLANYDGSHTHPEGPRQIYRGTTTPVGYFKIANTFGLYDMHGNVWEWCEDNWHNSYHYAPKDGSAWIDNCLNSRSRILRGGSWGEESSNCRSASRYYCLPGVRISAFSFRVACSIF